jgi:hypothetical protein
MIGQPPFGGFPGGTATTPETSVGLPSADVDLYTTRTAAALAALKARLSFTGATSINEPGPSSVISAGGS